jgi:hypothetical protein
VKLGERLVRAGWVTREDVDAALQAQVLYGRRLGTNLVELGLIDEDRLGEALSEHLGAPAAGADRFRAADAHARELVGVDAARRWLAFPLAIEDGELAIALADPGDARALAALGAAAHMRVRAYVAPEKRIREHLDRWQTKPPARPAARDGMPTRPLRIGPRPRAPSVPPVSIADAGARLDTARSREEIGDELIRVARGRVDAGLLFFVKAGRAHAWKAFGPGVDPSPPGLDAFAFSLSLPSPLEAAHRTRAPWRGHPVQLAVPEAIDALLPHEADAELVVLPVTVDGQVVNLYAAAAPAPLDAATVDALAGACDAAARAYARLIRQARSGT